MKYIFDSELLEERKVRGQKLEIWPRVERKIKKSRKKKDNKESWGKTNKQVGFYTRKKCS